MRLIRCVSLLKGKFVLWWQGKKILEQFSRRDMINVTGEHLELSTDQQVLEALQGMFELARNGEGAELKRMLEMGASARLCNDKGDSLLMLAAYHGQLETATLLLESGADPNRRNDQGQSPIVGAAYKGNIDMIRLLLEYGADVEGAGPSGKTALMMAAMFNRSAIVDLLLEYGADPRIKDVNGLSVVDAAKLMGAHDTAQQLEARVQ
jgi:uncharacterized protein